jgi:hypothetical protein
MLHPLRWDALSEVRPTWVAAISKSRSDSRLGNHVYLPRFFEKILLEDIAMRVWYGLLLVKLSDFSDWACTGMCYDRKQFGWSMLLTAFPHHTWEAWTMFEDSGY